MPSSSYDFDQDLLESSLRTKSVGRAVVYRNSTTSTMDDARALAAEGAAHGSVVLAEEQTAGRGTHGRDWVSPRGQNLYFTVLLRPIAGQLARLSMITPLAVANGVEQVTGVFPRIKWPNDLEIDGRKFAGILIEAEWAGRSPDHALVGVGLNVNFDPAALDRDVDRPATSLMIQLGRKIPREPLFAALLNSIERGYLGWSSRAVYEGWRARLATLGREVTVTPSGAEPFSGVADDVTEDGALVVIGRDGEPRTFHAGEVSLRAHGETTSRVG